MYLRITVAGNRADFGKTNIKIDSDHWDVQAQGIVGNDPNANFKNEQLVLMESKLLGIYNELLRKGSGISADRIRRMYAVPVSMSYMATFDLFQRDSTNVLMLKNIQKIS